MSLPETAPIVDEPVADPSRRIRRLVVVAAAVVALGVFAVTANRGGGGEPVASGPPLELSLGAGDAMASCMRVDAAMIAASPVALEATVTEIGAGTVSLEVDEWFTAGDAAQVELAAEGGQAALIAGFEFEVGGQYLVSATDETVNLCGMSGPATPELRALYDEAFGR